MPCPGREATVSIIYMVWMFCRLMYNRHISLTVKVNFLKWSTVKWGRHSIVCKRLLVTYFVSRIDTRYDALRASNTVHSILRMCILKPDLFLHIINHNEILKYYTYNKKHTRYLIKNVDDHSYVRGNECSATVTFDKLISLDKDQSFIQC